MGDEVETAEETETGTKLGLVVQSKVRGLVKDDARVSKEFLEALDNFVLATVNRAKERMKGNGRATLRADDI
jgi:histone H3/H4